ncbi:MAG: hypothetical protein JXQ27_11615 [Acidobacteria bacterium]|nr:hypothetical protein [Acidobacteriota bacterium]
MKEYSPNKFQALDPRKRWLYLAWMMENLLARREDSPADLAAREWSERLCRYVACLPQSERTLFAWDDVMDLNAADPAWRTAVIRLLDEVYERAGYDRENLRQLFAEPAPAAAIRRRVQPLRVIADGIRSPFNAGSIIRCAEAAGSEAVYLTGYTPGPDHPKVRRSAMSAQNYLPVHEMAAPLDAVRQCLADGYLPVALERTSGSLEYGSFPFPRPLALVVGNEELGIARPVLAACRHIIHIPMLGVKQSLNVSQALAVVLFACVHRWRAEERTLERVPRHIAKEQIID